MSARRLQATDLLSCKLPGDCQISPDGTRIAYTLQEIDREKNEYKTTIWVARAGRTPVAFTAGLRDHSPRWSPDGQHLAFVSHRSGSQQIWLLSLDGGEAHQLTRIKGGVSNPVWSPDSRYIAFIASLDAEGILPESQPEEEKDLYKRYTKDVRIITRLPYKMDGQGFLPDRYAQICVMAIQNGAPRQLTTGDREHLAPTWTPDSRGLIYTARHPERAAHLPWDHDLWYLPVEGEADPLLLTPSDEPLAVSGPSVSPDGAYVAFVAVRPKDQGYGLSHLYILERSTGSIHRMAVELDRSFAYEGLSDMPAPQGGRLTWSPDSRSIFALVSDAGQVHLVRVDVQTGSVAPVTGGEKMIHAYSLTPDCRRAALAYSSPTSPAEIYLAHLDQPQPAPPVPHCNAVLQGGGTFEVELTHHQADLLSQLEIPVPQRFTCSAGPGEPPVDAWILRPAAMVPGKKYPAVLEIHGGPMAMYGCGFFFEFQWLASLGYVVIYSNPRGSLGYGYDFCRCIMADWGNHDYADLMSVLESAVNTFDFIDPDRLGVAGGSYGGFMVNWIIGHTQRFKAAVTMRSVVNRWSAMGTSDVGYNRLDQFGTENWWEQQNMTPYLKQSPLLHASKIQTPLLIEHQEQDYRCPLEQAEQLYNALKVQNKEVKLVIYPGESHGMSRNGKPWSRVHRLHMMAEWFERFL